jgi:dihydrolipoamide dehydrogenase
MIGINEMPDRYDLVIIGAGPGGYVAAIRAAQLGMKVACVDKDRALGGTCLNVGCIPSKALLDSSELYYLAKNRFGRHGIQIDSLKLHLEGMLARKSAIVKSLNDGVAFLFRKNKVTFVQGTARLLGNGKVQVGGEKPTELEGGAILLATGSEPAGLPFLPFEGKQVVSSTEALSFSVVPGHLLVIGAGYIGLELGSVWCRLGAKVTVLEFLPKILPASDSELAGILHRLLARQGLDIHTATKVTAADRQGDKVTLHAEKEGQKLSFQGDKVLVSVGRRPCSANLGLEAAGVRLEEHTGKVIVNDMLETTAKGIYAIGDLIAGPMLAHKASEEGIAVAEHLAGKGGHVNYAAIPSAIYTHPELAAVGLTEEQVKEAGQAYKVGKSQFQASARAKCLDETEGLVKVITDAATDRVLGVHILGPRASDLLAEAVLALEFRGTAEDIARTCHGHPSLSEAVGEAARAAWSVALQS